jgi:hypothetical protein
LNVIICDGTWQTSGGTPSCLGTLQVVSLNELNQPWLSAEEYQQLRGDSIQLFMIIFGFLVLKKALNA